MTTREFFLDTSYAIALAAPADQLHDRAVALSLQLESSNSRLLTTQAVLFEIGNSLSKRRHRTEAVALISALKADPTVEIIPVTPDLDDAAFDLFRGRPDKEWGLIDCLSFVVMSTRKLSDALTADEHFEQAGFRALLRLP